MFWYLRLIVVQPAKQKAPPLLAALLTLPLRACAISPTSLLYPRCLRFIFTHVLTIPLLPKRIPIESLTQLSADLVSALQNLHHLSPFSPMTMSISDQSTIHLIANLVDLVLPRFKYPGLTLLSYNSCLYLLASLVASFPETVLGTPELKSWIIFPPDSGDVIEIDPRTRKQVLAFFSTSQVSTFLNYVHAPASIALGNYLSNLYFYWPSQCDQLFEAFPSDEAGPLVGLIYRTEVHDSPLGKSAVRPLIGKSTPFQESFKVIEGCYLADPANASHWPPLLFLAELYTHLSLNMTDDIFFSPTQNPLTIEEFQAFLQQLTYIVYCLDRLDFRGIAPLLGHGATLKWDELSIKLKNCLHTLYARQ
jgi:ubiquitin-protein ligase E3 C